MRVRVSRGAPKVMFRVRPTGRTTGSDPVNLSSNLGPEAKDKYAKASKRILEILLQTSNVRSPNCSLREKLAPIKRGMWVRLPPIRQSLCMCPGDGTGIRTGLRNQVLGVRLSSRAPKVTRRGLKVGRLFWEQDIKWIRFPPSRPR